MSSTPAPRYEVAELPRSRRARRHRAIESATSLLMGAAFIAGVIALAIGAIDLLGRLL